MKVLIAPDKFKGSLSAREVCDTIASAIRESGKPFQLDCVPMADGGEGTCEILTYSRGGRWETCETVDPLGKRISTAYGVSPDKKTAYIEMASASGLHLLEEAERNPVRTSSFGTGIMIRDALANGATEIVLGIGGSSTNDGGIGMAAALGYRFLNADGDELKPIGMSLGKIATVESPLSRRINCELTVLCDVTNPLYGINGAAFVFGPQKGAEGNEVRQLDEGLRHLATVVQRQLGKDMNFEGAGAGGGIAAGAFAFLNGRIVSGVRYLIDVLGIEDRIRHSDLIITGEGKLDSQSLSGKVVSGISEVCHRTAKPFMIFCGTNELNENQAKRLGAMTIGSLVKEGITKEQAIGNAAALLKLEVDRCLAEVHFGG